MANYLANQDESLKEGQVPVQAQVIATTATPVVIPVPVEREVITNDMKKAYSYSYTIKWVSGIDMFFALLYSFYNLYWLFFVFCSYAGYYGAKNFKILQLYFYFLYEVGSVIVKAALLSVMTGDNNINGYGVVMTILSIIVGIWVSELTFKLIRLMRHMTDHQLNLVRNIGYKPRAIVYI